MNKDAPEEGAPVLYHGLLVFGGHRDLYKRSRRRSKSASPKAVKVISPQYAEKGPTDEGLKPSVCVTTEAEVPTPPQGRKKKRGVPRITEIKVVKNPKATTGDSVKERASKTANPIEELLADITPLLEGWLIRKMGGTLRGDTNHRQGHRGGAEARFSGPNAAGPGDRRSPWRTRRSGHKDRVVQGGGPKGQEGRKG